MKEFCRECHHRGDVICELPSRGEQVMNAARLVVFMVAELAMETGGVVPGGVAVSTDMAATAFAKGSINAVEERVDACIAFHETLRADPLS